MTSISLYCRNSLGLLLASSSRVSPLSYSSFANGRAKKGSGDPRFQNDDDDDFEEGGDEDEGGVAAQSKISKGSLDKIKQRFTKIYKRQVVPKGKGMTDEERELRKFIKDYAKYSQQTAMKRDAEEKQKMDLQWEAIAELPEDLRKIAMLIDTHDEEPEALPFWFDTPPAEDPQSKIHWKKKDKHKVVKRSEELITGDLF